MSKRAELRWQWRSDRKNLKIPVSFRRWTPSLFDDVKAAIAKSRGS